MRIRISFAILLIVAFLSLTISSCNDNLASDGYMEVGFPIVFYRIFNGKCFDCKFEQGFMILKFAFDISLLFVSVFVSDRLMKRILK